MMQLQDSKLLREQCYIDGAWAPADSGGTIPVHNPATDAQIGVIPNMGTTETRRAIEAAARALHPGRHARPRNAPSCCAAGSN